VASIIGCFIPACLNSKNKATGAAARVTAGPSAKDDTRWREFGLVYWYFPSQN
jgi:hypothetical protein